MVWSQVQVRKWVRNYEALRTTRPKAKLVRKACAFVQMRIRSHPSLYESESFASSAPCETPPPGRASSLQELPPVARPATLEHAKAMRVAEDLLLLHAGSMGR